MTATGHRISYTGCRYTGQQAVLPLPSLSHFRKKGNTHGRTSNIFGTPVKIKGTFLIPIVIVWGGITWLEFSWHPERAFWQGILMGCATMLLLLVVEGGHALAHIFSARVAGAQWMRPLFALGQGCRERSIGTMRFHRMSIGYAQSGGPIFNAVGLLLSAGIYAVA